MRVNFIPRDAILDPIAVVGMDEAAHALARRLLTLDGERLRQLRGAAGDRLMIVLGETANLPWVDGVTYLGRDREAPRLLLPAMLRPDIAFDVFERLVGRIAAPLPAPWAVFSSPPRIFSVAAATVIDREEVLKWLDEQS